jgi:hypothetical protein
MLPRRLLLTMLRWVMDGGMPGAWTSPTFLVAQHLLPPLQQQLQQQEAAVKTPPACRTTARARASLRACRLMGAWPYRAQAPCPWLPQH